MGDMNRIKAMSLPNLVKESILQIIKAKPLKFGLKETTLVGNQILIIKERF